MTGFVDGYVEISQLLCSNKMIAYKRHYKKYTSIGTQRFRCFKRYFERINWLLITLLDQLVVKELLDIWHGGHHF